MISCASLLVLGGLLSRVAPDLAAPAQGDPVPRTGRHRAEVTWLAGGPGTTCAVRDGAVYCWGDPLGIRDLERAIVAPERVSGLAGVDEVSVFSGSACARIGARVMCWGDNRWGELGDGTTTERREPVPVRKLEGAVEQVFAGQHHSCAIVDGGARCWGHGLYGQLGDGTKRAPVTVPVQVRGLTAGVTNMATSLFNTCAVVKGRVKCWGENTSGQLAIYPHTNRTTPVDAVAKGDDFIGVRSGAFTSCAFALNRVVCWGDHSWTSPDGFGPISDLALGDGGGCVIRSGVVACFRWDSDEPVNITLPAPATQISCGQRHACALAGGEVYCWGNRGFGALGDGTPAKPKFDPNFVRPQPATVAWPPNTP